MYIADIVSIENGGWPTSFELFPRLQKVGRFIGRVLGAPVVHDYHSEHYRGAAEMIDHELYDQVRVEGFLYDGEHPAEELNGYAEISDELRYGVEDGQ